MQAPTIRTVLCAVDFSSATRATLDRAVDLARRHGLDRIHLVHVAEIVGRDGDGDPRTLVDWMAREEAAAARTRRVADDLARDSGLAVEPEFRSGIAWREIADCARALGADLLVVGTHPTDAAEPSVAEQLVRGAPCTVVAVRPPADG
jgi:universal stress protein A